MSTGKENDPTPETTHPEPRGRGPSAQRRKQYPTHPPPSNPFQMNQITPSPSPGNTMKSPSQPDNPHTDHTRHPTPVTLLVASRW